MTEPDIIDQMSDEELRKELRKMIIVGHPLKKAMQWVYACPVKNENQRDMIRQYEALSPYAPH